MAVDLPTMGNVYVMADMVVRYYNGLGSPVSPDGLGATGEIVSYFNTKARKFTVTIFNYISETLNSR